MASLSDGSHFFVRCKIQSNNGLHGAVRMAKGLSHAAPCCLCAGWEMAMRHRGKGSRPLIALPSVKQALRLVFVTGGDAVLVVFFPFAVPMDANLRMKAVFSRIG